MQQHFSKFAGLSLVAFIVISIAWTSALCHMGDCGKYAGHCSIRGGVAVCAAAGSNG